MVMVQRIRIHFLKVWGFCFLIHSHMISYPKTVFIFLWQFRHVVTQVKYDSAYNLLCSLGFLASLQGVRFEQAVCANLFSHSMHCKRNERTAQVRTLAKDGLYWIAPPCNTWVWLSRATTGRSRTRVRGMFSSLFDFQSGQIVKNAVMISCQMDKLLAWGKKNYKKNRRANRLVRRMLYLQPGCKIMLVNMCSGMALLSTL